MNTNDIRQKIGRYFRINMEQFLLEILDKRYQLYILLDDLYFEKLRSDLHTTGNNFFDARIRSINQSCYDVQFDSISLEESCTEITIDSPRPDHIIVWLDEDIGRPQYYQQLKNYFKSIIAIELPNFFLLNTDLDIDNLIRINDSENIEDFNLNDIRDEIYAFSTSEDCLIFIDKVSKSKINIFLICSGSLGEECVPKIYDNSFVHSIFVLDFDILRHYEWACDYIEKVQIFAHERDLLARLARDIADYYQKKSSEKMTKNPRYTLTYLHWIRRLLINASIVDEGGISRSHLKYIDQRIFGLDDYFNSQIECEKDEKVGVACTEV